MISPFSPATLHLVQAVTQRTEITGDEVTMQRHEVSVATTEKPRLEGGIGEMIFGPDRAKAKDNSATISRFIEKAVGMAKALARLQGTSVQAVMGNLPGGGIMQASSGWSYEAEVEIYAGGGARLSSQMTGTKGDDTLTINTGDASQKEVTDMSALPGGIDAGDGNDALTIASQLVRSIQAGAGDDRVAIDAMLATNIDGGAGNDAIAIASSEIMNVDGGSGADAISLAAHNIYNVYGGAGRDAINVQARAVFNVNGGAGADAISVKAGYAGNIKGGAGNDAITVQAQHGAQIHGGAGDDVINAQVSGIDGKLTLSGGAGNDLITVDADMALLRFEGGDGQDQVQITRAHDLTISLGVTDLNTAAVSFDENTLNIALADGSHMSITGLAGASSIRIISDTDAGVDLRSYSPVNVVF